MLMKRIYNFVTLLLMIFGATIMYSCIDNKNVSVVGNKTTNSLISLQDFNEIQVNCAAEVVYIAGKSSPSITITCDDDIRENIIVKVVDSKLCLGIKGSKNYDSLKFEINGTAMLEDIDIAGAGLLSIDGKLNPRNLDIDCAGASKVEINGISCAELKIDCSGASNVNVGAIDCDELEVDCIGASLVIVGGRCQNAEYEANGASTIDVKNMNAVKVEKEEFFDSSKIKK